MKHTLLSHDGQSCRVSRYAILMLFLALQQFAFAQLSVSVTSTTNVSCNGGSDGAIDITVSGGVAPYTYTWSNGASTEDISSLSAGPYSVTVTDALASTASTSATITQPAALTVTKTVVDVTCNGGSDGSFSVSVGGGTPPYTYAWSSGESTSSITNHSSGPYDVTITDNNGCSLTVIDTIGEPSQFMIISPTASPVSCYGGSDGSSSMLVVGGILPYTYTWSNGAITKDLSNVPAGTYTVMASDNNGCKDFATVVITQPAQAISATTNITSSTCYNSADGAIDVTVSGGTPPYTYLWNTADVTEDLNNIPAGNYSLTITDDNGCTLDINPVVTAIDAVQPVAVCQNIDLFLDATGSATITAAQIDNGSSDNCSLDTLVLDKYSFSCADLGANTVEFIAYDSNGNSDTCSATVTVIDTVSPLVATMNHTVNLDATGNATVTTADFDNGTADACGLDTIFLDRYNFDCSDIGVQTVSITAIDNNGNTSTATADLTVVDNIAPVAVARDITVYLDVNGQVSITAAQVDNGSSDVCGIDTLILDRYDFTCADQGVQAVNLTVVDVDSNTDVAPANVTVLDTFAPVLNVQDINVYLDNAGSVSITAADVVVSATDACGMDTIILDTYSFTCAEVGPNTVQVSATDVNANLATGSVTVTVLDTNTPDVQAQDITVYLDATGQASITVADIDNGSATVCGTDTLYLDTYSFSCNEVGTNKVALIAESVNSVQGTDTAIVTVVDSISPVVATQNLTVYLSAAGTVSITAADIDNGTADACGLDTLILDRYDFTCAESGTNTVNLTAIDVNGNTTSASASVDVHDTISPVLASQDITVYLDVNGQASILAADVVASATDNCMIDTVILDIYNFGCADTGTNTVNLTAFDPSGNADAASAIVTVVDTINPEVLAQDITVYLDITGNVSVTAGQVDAGSGTACGMDTLLLDKYDFDCSSLGANTVYLTAIKPNGNQTSDTAVVTVLDTLAPVLAPNNITAYLDASGMTSITVNDIDSNISDACGLDSASLDITDFTCANVGPNMVKLTAWDINGNGDSALAVVMVLDTLAPDFSVNDTTIYLDATGNASITNAYVSGAATDICGVDTVLLDTYNFSCTEAGVNLVTVTATDVNGNASSQQVNVTVVDTIDPVLTSTDINLYLDANGQASIVPGDVIASATDACTIDTLILDKYGFDCADLGANTVNITAVDPFGNSTSASATVSVFDTVAPAVSNQNVSIYLDTSGSVSISQLNVNTYLHEACDLDTIYFSKQMFACADLGDNRIGMTAIDASGNRVDDSLTVTVRDTTPPNLVNQNLTVYLDASGNASITTTDVNQLTSDVCGIDTTWLDRYTFSCAELGANTVTMYARDLNGTVGSATATVTVVDTVQPVVKAHNITIYVDSNGIAKITPADIDNGSFDSNCSYNLLLSDSIFDCGELGLNLEQLMIVDGGGNIQSVDFFVTVLDTISPTLMLNDITVSLNANGKAFITADQLDSASFDNCTNLLYFTASKTAFDCSNIGANTVAVTATDNKLNTTTANVTVTVVDATAPTAVARDLNVYLDASGNAVASANDVDNGSTDNCGMDSLWLSQSSFTGADLGPNAVKLYAKDMGGNISMANSIITVIDTIKPVIAAQNFTIYLDANGQVNFNAMASAVATDNHQVVSMNVSRTNFSCADIGTNSITVAAVDPSGNNSSAPVSITVMDTLAPVVSTKNATLYLDALGNAVLAAADVDANSSDNCSIQSMSLSQSAFTCSDLGSNVINLIVNDANGNTASNSLVVTVLDTTAPVLANVPADMSVSADANSCGANVNFTMPVINDNCANTSISSTHMPGAFFPVGTTVVRFSVQDAGGNMDTASFSITVEDNAAPVITSMPTSDTVGYCEAFYHFSLPVATDNCSGATVTQIGGIPSGAYYPVGATTNSFHITDGNGNDTVVSFTVTVEPLGTPVLPTVLSMCVNDEPVDLANGQDMDWSGNGMQDGTTFDPALAGKGQHQLSYTFVDGRGCTSSGSIAITVSPVPVQPVISRIASTTLSTGAYDTYQWYRDGVAIPGATKQTYSYTVGGNYQVMVGNIASCQSYSDGYVVGKNGGGIGIEENLLSNLSIYPNPTSGVITIDLNNISREQLEVSLYSITGKVVLHRKDFTETDGKMRLDLANLPKATYFLHISSESEVVVRQVVRY